MVDGRRLRKPDKKDFRFAVLVEDPQDILAIDRIVKDLHNPPNRIIFHNLLQTYLKHVKPGEIML